MIVAGGRAQQLEARPSRRVDDEVGRRPAAPRRAQAGLLADLGQLDVLEQRADGCELGPRERPECRQDRRPRGWAFNCLSPARLSKCAAGTGVAAAPAISIHLRRSASASEAVRGNDLAGREAHDLAGKSAAGISPTSNSPVEMSSEASATVALSLPCGAFEQRGEVVACLGVEQAFLGQRAGRHEAHDVAMHDGLGAAFSGLCRVFHLLANGHPETFGDQPLQVFIGAMDGTPHMGMSSPRCLPRLVSTMPSASAAATASSKNNS